MSDHKKQAISIRLGNGDMRNVKRAAKRLGVRDSDIIRFALKSMLTRIAPMCDEAVVGRNLVPVLVECGDELIRYFELDAYRLDGIVNERADERQRVDSSDIALLTMSTLRDQYLLMRIRDGANTPDPAAPVRSLREYLIEKYIYPSPRTAPSSAIPYVSLDRLDSRTAERPAA